MDATNFLAKKGSCLLLGVPRTPTIVGAAMRPVAYQIANGATHKRPGSQGTMKRRPPCATIDSMYQRNDIGITAC